MDLSKIKKPDDNTIFRYLSKPYRSKNTTVFLDSINRTIESSKGFTTIQINKTIRSQSSSIYNNLSKSQNISQNYSIQKPGFLKYRKSSIRQPLHLNSITSTSNKSMHKWSEYNNTMNERNFTEMKKTINDFNYTKEGTRNFGLRNVVRSFKNQFRSEDEDFKHPDEFTPGTEEEILCDKSRKIFLGVKRYNLNGFLFTQNLRSLKKAKKSIINSTIKSSLLRKNLNRQQEKQTLYTEA